MRAFFCFTLFFCVSYTLLSQSLFVRPSISVVEIVDEDGISIIDPSSIEYLNSVDVNKIETTKVKFKNMYATYDSQEESGTQNRKEDIMNLFKKENIAGEVILFLLPIEDGTFSNSKLKERGLYTANDAEINALKGSINANFGNLADNFGELGIKQLDLAYVLLLDFSNLVKRRIQDGTKSQVYLEADLKYYLVKIDNILDAVNQYYENPIGVSTANWGGKIVSSKAYKVQSEFLKFGTSRKQLKQSLGKAAVASCFERIIREEPAFQPRTTITKDRGRYIEAKIGSKENLKIDNRFFVYEQVQSVNKADSTEKVVLKKRGQVRVKSVADNVGISEGKSPSSVFYKVAGQKYDEGMLIIQKEDLGFGISVGYGTLNFLRVDYRIKGIYPGWKVFATFIPSAFSGDIEFDVNVLDDKFNTKGVALIPKSTTWNFQVGFEASYILSSRFEILPFAAFGLGFASLSGDFYRTAFGKTYSIDAATNQYTSYQGSLGGRLKLNLFGGLSLVGSLGYTFTVSQVFEDLKYDASFGDINKYLVGGAIKESNRDKLQSFYKGLFSENPANINSAGWDVVLRYEF